MQGIRFPLRPVALLVAVACNTTLAAEAPALKEMVVTATRSATDVDSVAATVTTVNRTQLDRSLPTDEAGLFQDEGDIAFARDLRRHGATATPVAASWTTLARWTRYPQAAPARTCSHPTTRACWPS